MVWALSAVCGWVLSCAQIDGRALGGLHRLAKQGELRACLREDLGITRIGSMLGFIDELYKLMSD